MEVQSDRPPTGNKESVQKLNLDLQKSLKKSKFERPDPLHHYKNCFRIDSKVANKIKPPGTAEATSRDRSYGISRINAKNHFI